MWAQFTKEARRAIFLAQDEAQRFGSARVSAEHLLLALLGKEDNIATVILRRINVSPINVRAEVEQTIERSDSAIGVDMCLTERCKRIIDLAYDEAKRLKNDHIGTEHLLLGMLRESVEPPRRTLRQRLFGHSEQEPGPSAGDILASRGVNRERVIDEIRYLERRGLSRVVAGTDDSARLLRPTALDEDS